MQRDWNATVKKMVVSKVHKDRVAQQHKKTLRTPWCVFHRNPLCIFLFLLNLELISTLLLFAPWHLQ